MKQFAWILALVAGLGGGVATRWLWPPPAPHEAVDPSAVVATLNHKLASLQEQLRTRDIEVASLRRQVDTLVAADAIQEPAIQPPALPTPPADGGSSIAPAAAQLAEAPAETPTEGDDEPPTVEAALARLSRYFRETAGMGRRELLGEQRRLLGELRAMGEPAVIALLQTLKDSEDSRERGAAAAFAGALQDASVLPALQDLLEREEDLVVRRGAARGVRQMQSPEAIPLLETLLENPQEDRFIRLNAAYGLAELGETQGIEGLVQIFDESEVDGRGHYLAFQALANLPSDGSLPFLRQLVTSTADVTYRLKAIDILAEHQDQAALPFLNQVLASPGEQPSVLEAAAKAVAGISDRR